MSRNQVDEAAIFNIARRISDLEVREDYVQQVCGDNTALRSRVNALLQVQDYEPEFLAAPPCAIPETERIQSVDERPGMSIGSYTLREQIGEGGFGVVFVAEQETPIQRKVALKVVKPGMDTKEVIARFEAERQALALMSHPSIANVLDGGTTESGRPYFVMELVRGVPITEYCDRQKLTTEERLRLFVTVCKAVQHAHQKGVIHRDLKPSNILVTEHDGQPVPKVIDFGVAKAINQRLTVKTIYTRFHQMIGTPMYMSPEQAELSGLDVDTRSDVYSLGVLLYELVTGATPFDAQSFSDAAYDEIRRIIRDVDPSKPSTKVLNMGDVAVTVSELRRTDTHRLTQALRGDVDWIVMKALEKDRSRRYQSANGFSEDVERFLSEEPIEARPPSNAYRLHKFMRRHKARAVFMLVIVATIVMGMFSTGLALVRANQHARVAAANAAAASLEAKKVRVANEQLETTNLDLAAKNKQVSAMLLDQAIGAAMNVDRTKTGYLINLAMQSGASESQREFVYGLLEQSAGDPTASIQHLRLAVDSDDKNIPAKCLLCRAHLDLAEFNEHFQLLDAIKTADPLTAHDHLFWGLTLTLDRPKRAVELIERGQELRDSPIAQAIHANALQSLAFAERDLALAKKALDESRRAQALLGKDHRTLAIYTLLCLDTYVAIAREEGVESSDKMEYAHECALQLGESSNPWAHASAAIHYAYIENDIDAAESAWKRSVALQRAGGAWQQFYALFVFTRYGATKAIAELDEVPHKNAHFLSDLHAYLWALSPNRRVRADALWNEMRTEQAGPAWGIQLALFLGHVDQAIATGKRWLTIAKRNGHLARAEKIEYLLGVTPEHEWLKGDSPDHYLTAAMKRLSEGGADGRKKAIAHLRKVLSYGEYLWTYKLVTHLEAEGFLAQLEQDQNWPKIH